MMTSKAVAYRKPYRKFFYVLKQILTSKLVEPLQYLNAACH